ncbi:MAG: hypothetical protein J6Y82_12055 [Bacteroidales bacterium]|nr:hypothetical protein [Bacteroidales bacterium]
MTATAKNINRLQGRSPAFSNGVGQSLRRTKTFYEFKSVKDVPPANFLEQFGKDLKNTDVSDLSQIKWIFDGKKVSQQELTETMTKTIKEWKVPEDILRKWGYEGKLQLFKDEKLYPNIDNIFKAE